MSAVVCASSLVALNRHPPPLSLGDSRPPPPAAPALNRPSRHGGTRSPPGFGAAVGRNRAQLVDVRARIQEVKEGIRREARRDDRSAARGHQAAAGGGGRSAAPKSAPVVKGKGRTLKVEVCHDRGG